MKSHPLDLISLVFGMIFIAAAVLWLVTEVGSLPRHALLWVVPGGLVLVGAAGIAHALRSPRPHGGRDDRPTR